MELVFVYGTLRPGGEAEGKMADCQWVGGGHVEGKLYQIDWYPGLVLEKKIEAENWVLGDIFEVPGDTNIMDNLDHYEGCEDEDGKPQEFKRVKAKVITDDGEELEVWVWEYERDPDKYRVITSGDWLKR